MSRCCWQPRWSGGIISLTYSPASAWRCWRSQQRGGSVIGRHGPRHNRWRALRRLLPGDDHKIALTTPPLNCGPVQADEQIEVDHARIFSGPARETVAAGRNRKMPGAPNPIGAFSLNPYARSVRFACRSGAAGGLAAESAGLLPRRFEEGLAVAEGHPPLANRHAAPGFAVDAAIDGDKPIGRA